MKPSLRRGTAADTATLWAVRTAAIREGCKTHYDPELVEAWASTPQPASFVQTVCDPGTLVAELDGTTVGFGMLDVGRAQIAAIYVDPRNRRHGIGRAVLVGLEQEARGLGITALRLSASLNGVPFYEASGYRAVGESMFHHPRGFDLPCVEMHREL